MAYHQMSRLGKVISVRFDSQLVVGPSTPHKPGLKSALLHTHSHRRALFLVVCSV